MYDFSQTATAIQLEKRDHQRFQACDLDVYIAPGVYSTMSIELGRSCLYNTECRVIVYPMMLWGHHPMLAILLPGKNPEFPSSSRSKVAGY
jgi:hypothetical protein